MKIEYYAEVSTSPAWRLIRIAEDELASEGFLIEPHVSPAPSDPVMIAIDDEVNAGAIMGFMVYQYDRVKASWYILIAWVQPHRRLEGVHTRLFETLVARAKKRGDIRTIECGTHVDNIPAQRAFERQGRKAVAIVYEYRLLDHVQGKDPLEIEK
jgi:ribosomal protein S18 acetylase RimI-like enzyme